MSLTAWLRSRTLREGLLAGCLAVGIYLGVDYGLVAVGMESLRTRILIFFTAVLVGVTTSIFFGLLSARYRE
jgi:hypothetical protein